MSKTWKVLLPAALLAGALAQQNAVPPELPYKVAADWPQLPLGMNLGETSGVDTDSRGHVYVFNRGQQPIVELDPAGKFVRAWGEGMITSAHGLRVDRENNIWAVDVAGHTVLKMNPQGRVVMVLGRRGTAGATQTNFNRPTDVAVAPNGDFYVADGYGNSRVMKFSKDGNFLLEWGKKGTAPGEFNLPHTVALDSRGRVYVGDRENHRIQIFDPNGMFLAEWKHAGSPWGLDITPDQRIFMADGYKNQVVLLNLEGQILGRLGGPGKLPGQFDFAHAISVSSAGDIYVAEILNWRAQKFVRR